TASNDTNDHHILAFFAIQEEVLADRKPAYARPQIVATPPGTRMRIEQVEPFGYRLDQTICDFEAAAFKKDVEGDVLEIPFGLRGEAIRDQRGVAERSAAIRRRRRCLISSASACVVSFVNSRPSPRAREASASSIIAMISSRRRSRSSHRAKASSIASSTRLNRPLSMAF